MPKQIETFIHARNHKILVQIKTQITHTHTSTERERERERIMPCCVLCSVRYDITINHMPMFCGGSELNVASILATSRFWQEKPSLDFVLLPITQMDAGSDIWFYTYFIRSQNLKKFLPSNNNNNNNNNNNKSKLYWLLKRIDDFITVLLYFSYLYWPPCLQGCSASHFTRYKGAMCKITYTLGGISVIYPNNNNNNNNRATIC